MVNLQLLQPLGEVGLQLLLQLVLFICNVGTIFVEITAETPA